MSVRGSARLATNLLGRHVAGGAHDDAGRSVLVGQRDLIRIRSRGLHQLRQSEVQNLDAPVFRDENVFRLQIAMDDSLLVRGREPVGDLHSILERLPLRQRSAFEHRPQAFALQKLRDQKWRAVSCADIERPRECWDG